MCRSSRREHPNRSNTRYSDGRWAGAPQVPGEAGTQRIREDAAMKRLATAIWKGGRRAGEGTVSTASGVFNNVLFTASTSHEEFPCTCPSEMLAAAAGSCVSLMVAKELATAKIPTDHV